MVLIAFVEQVQLDGKLGQHLDPVLSLALSLGRIEAQHIAFAPLAIADPDFLDLQIVGDLAISAGAGQHLGLDVLDATHRHRQHVAAEAAAEFGEVVGRVHASVADEQAATELPSVQILLDARDRCHVGGVARQHPRAHRHAVARDRHGDDDLRVGVAAFLTMAALTQWREQLAAPQLAVLVGFVDLEIGRGGVIEDKVNVEAQQIGAAQEHVALDLL